MLYNIIVLKLSIFFCVIHDCVTVILTCDGYVTVIYDIMLTSNLKFKIRKLL